MPKEKDADTGAPIIWITDAAYEYRKSRAWFQARIEDGRIRTAAQKGSIRVYMLVEDVEKEIAKDN